MKLRENNILVGHRYHIAGSEPYFLNTSYTYTKVEVKFNRTLCYVRTCRWLTTFADFSSTRGRRRKRTFILRLLSPSPRHLQKPHSCHHYKQRCHHHHQRCPRRRSRLPHQRFSCLHHQRCPHAPPLPPAPPALPPPPPLPPAPPALPTTTTTTTTPAGTTSAAPPTTSSASPPPPPPGLQGHCPPWPNPAWRESQGGGRPRRRRRGQGIIKTTISYNIIIKVICYCIKR